MHTLWNSLRAGRGTQPRSASLRPDVVETLWARAWEDTEEHGHGLPPVAPLSAGITALGEEERHNGRPVGQH